MDYKEKEYIKAYKNFCTAFEALTGSPDPFNYSRAKELHVSLLLGLSWCSGFDGADALDLNGNQIEIKTTTAKNINGTYNGLSVYENWQDFLEYLWHKFPENTRHIFARYEGPDLAEVYELDNDKVLDILESKLVKNFDENGLLTEKKKNAKDPRLGASVSMTEIKKYGEKIELYRQ